MKRWKAGSIIREKLTGTPYLVLHVYKNVCTILSDARSKDNLPQAVVLFERDYDKYCLDSDMQEKHQRQWAYDPLPSFV